MARKVSSRTKVNRAALEKIRAGSVDGMEEMGQAWAEMAHPPDAAPFGEGLIETPDWGIWVDGKKVAGTAPKPKRAKVKTGITLLAGAGFPTRFNIFGTNDTAANPGWFVGPMSVVLPGAHKWLGPALKRATR